MEKESVSVTSFSKRVGLARETKVRRREIEMTKERKRERERERKEKGRKEERKKERDTTHNR